MVVLSWLVSAVARSAGDTTRLGSAARTGNTTGAGSRPAAHPGYAAHRVSGRDHCRLASFASMAGFVAARPGRRAGMPGTARRTGGRAGSSYQRANAAVVIQMAA